MPAKRECIVLMGKCISKPHVFTQYNEVFGFMVKHYKAKFYCSHVKVVYNMCKIPASPLASIPLLLPSAVFINSFLSVPKTPCLVVVEWMMWKAKKWLVLCRNF